MNRLSSFFEKTDPSRREADDWKKWLSFTTLCRVQGGYYLLRGLGPLVSLASFESVTGPRADFWLVSTLGLLVTLVGTTLLMAAWRQRAATELALLAAGSTVALTAIDVLHILGQTIAPVYVLDAAVELVLLAGWVRLLAPEKDAGASLGIRVPNSLQELPR